jgi:hypothetical protein
VFTL